MNENLRWKLVLGCLMIAALEAPHAFLLLVEDFTGPYCARVEEGSSATREAAELDTSCDPGVDPTSDIGLALAALETNPEASLAAERRQLTGDSHARR